MNKLARPLRLFLDRAGSAAVEFALILPLMSVLLFGFYEMGRMFFVYNIASAAARDAARFGARLPMVCGSFTNGGDEDRVRSVGATGDADPGSNPLIPGLTTADIDVDYGCVPNSGEYAGVYQDATEVPTLTVTVNAPFATHFLALFPGFDLDGIVVSHSETWTE